MSNISTLFKISNIDISGGNISDRSALKSTQLNLSWFLIKLSDGKGKDWLNMNIIYPFTKTTSNLVLSTKVNNKLYDQLNLEKFKTDYPYSFGQQTKILFEDQTFIAKLNTYIHNNAS
jgi:hypothetical protein